MVMEYFDADGRRRYVKILLWIPLLVSLMSLLIYAYPGLFLAEGAYLVSPENPGADLSPNTLVLTRPADRGYLTTGDTVTYRLEDSPEAPLRTGEVIDTQVVNGSRQLRVASTGDWMPEENAYREVIMTVPLLGQFIAIVHTFPGLFVFILLPAALLVAMEASSVLEEIGIGDDDRSDDTQG